MPQLKTYDLFISHSWSYGDAYEKLCSLLDAATNFKYRNYSVPKNDPIHNAPSENALYQAIKRQISPANIVIIMAGKYATYSKWINKEIQIAKKEFYFPKPILAVAPWGSQQISSVVRNAADEIAGWNTSSIVGAIRRLSV
ncbi:MAG: TIR domain-containing protein [Thermodesulfobacteriota bacterium]